MTTTVINVLLIEDSPGDARLLQTMLVGANDTKFNLRHARRLSEGLACLAEGGVDAVLLDLGLPDSRGFETFTRVYAQAPEVPVIVLTGLEDETLAVEAVRAGAQDYLLKGEVAPPLLVRAIRYAIERHRAEAAIRQLNVDLDRRIRERTAELEAANRELESFSYSVSHDLRAPLRAIAGFSEALLEDCSSQLDERGKHYLDRVRAATEHMGQLIEDLLELGRVMRVEMYRQQVDLSSMAQRIASDLRESQPARQATFVVAPGVLAEGDARLLRVVLENLLGNAWKYTGKQPQTRIEFGFSMSHDPPAFFVRDNGAGFDMQYAWKLFSPFQRLHSTGEFEGTGIGLATVQRIIHRHGGRVWAEGAMGEGATFHFTLPCEAVSDREHTRGANQRALSSTLS